MRGSRSITVAAGALVLALGAMAPAPAAPEEGRKLPHPGKHLKDALKNLAKLESYEVSLRVEGGLSDNEKHEITRRTVRQSYTGNVFQNRLMHVPALQAFRTPKKGVRFSSGAWRNVLADRTGVLVDRLFDFPMDVMTKAFRHSRSAEWVETARSEELEAEEHEGLDVVELEDLGIEPEEGDGADAESPSPASGKTVVVGKPEEDDEKELELPRLIRVAAPPREALRHYVSVEKSGCIGGG